VRVDQSFEAFVEECSPGLLRTAYLLTLDRGHAEDLVQTALLRAVRHWRSARVAPLAYVRKVLVNLALDRRRTLRRRVTETPLLTDESTPPSHSGLAERAAERQMVVDALRRLPQRQRQVVVLRFFADLSVPETAQVLGCSEGTVKSYTARALSRLRELLADPSIEEVFHA
jgi:RNA polymerase sigma-70 factor (sigma-E family)